MAGAIVDLTSKGNCPHQTGQLTLTATGSRVKVDNQAVTLISDQFQVQPGCSFQVPVGAGTKPQPCTTGRWTLAATRVTVQGQAVVIQQPSPLGICQSAEQIPAGPPTLTKTQTRVTAT
jgi:hypothetical protein